MLFQNRTIPEHPVRSQRTDPHPEPMSPCRTKPRPQMQTTCRYPQTRVRYVIDIPRVAGAIATAIALVVTPLVPWGHALAMVPSVLQPAAKTGNSYTPEWEPVPIRRLSEGDTRQGETQPLVTVTVNPSKWDDLCYFQGDPRWGSEMFQTGSIADTGCGLCATAHALTILLDEEIPPDVLSARLREYSDSVGGIDYGSCGVVWAGWEEVVDGAYGDLIEIGRTECTPAAVREALSDGKMVIFNPPAGAPLKLTDGTMFTIGGGHVVMCYKYENGTFYEKDSGYQPDGYGEASQIAYSENEFAQVMEGCQSHLGYVYTLGLRTA